MNRMLRTFASGAALLGLDGWALLALRSDPARLAGGLAHPREWVDQVGADAAVLEMARTGLFLASAWLAIGLGAALLANGGGPLARSATSVADRVLPGVLRRLVIGTLGAGLVLGPVPMLIGTTSAGASTPVHPNRLSAPGGPRVDWPTDGRDAPPLDLPWPSTPSTPGTPSTPSTPATPDSPRTPTPPTTAQPRPAGAAKVTVRPGDCLWTITARHLGPTATEARVAASWPAWYRANAASIGPDPSTLRPGQVLVVPESNGSA